MNINLLDIDTFIKVNGCQEITNPVMLDKGNVPTSEGLFSTEIFGISTKDRKNTFAYINLGKKFLTPKAYITLKRLNRNFENVIHGTKRFIIKDGVIVENDEGETGVQFLYDNWEKLKFTKTESRSRNIRSSLMSTANKDLIFTDKFIVIPAFYRDINLQNINNGVNINEINELYSKLIRNAKTLESTNMFDFMTYSIEGRTQDILVEIYDTIKSKIAGKNGYLRKFLLGKSVDYASRVVITAVPYDNYDPNRARVTFTHTGVPLAHVCSEFTPFIIWWVKQYFKSRFEDNKSRFPVLDKDGKMMYAKLKDPEIYYSEEFIEKRLKKFIKTPSTRFDKIQVPLQPDDLKKTGKDAIYAMIQGFDYATTTMDKDPNKLDGAADKGDQAMLRYLTWTDVFYMAAVDVTENKHILVTRYPLSDHLGTYPSKITVLSTQETQPMVINDKLYKFYPIIDTNVGQVDIEARFIDSAQLHPVFLPGLGGDHDGDQVTIKGLFSQEANDEADRIMEEKSFVMNIYGDFTRTLGNEGVQTLYTLTRFR